MVLSRCNLIRFEFWLITSAFFLFFFSYGELFAKAASRNIISTHQSSLSQNIDHTKCALYGNSKDFILLIGFDNLLFKQGKVKKKRRGKKGLTLRFLN